MYYLLVYTSYTITVASIKTAEAVGEHTPLWEPALGQVWTVCPVSERRWLQKARSRLL